MALSESLQMKVSRNFSGSLEDFLGESSLKGLLSKFGSACSVSRRVLWAILRVQMAD